jgi:acetylornithine deacetylase/succinyl-diaminopimelate desuccinylase family protein
MTYEKNLSYGLIDNLEGEIIGTLKEMIEIPTVNPPGLNYPDFIGYMKRLFDDWGIEYKVIPGPAGRENRASIIGMVRGTGKKSLHFHGHYDVVPALNDDQFKPFVKDGKLFGRGSSDMKGGIVSMLYAIRILNEDRSRLNGSVSFSLTPDEETGGTSGIRYLFKEGHLPLDGCIGMIMSEPSSGVIWNASKGALTIKVIFKGKFAHIGLADEGINAFERMVSTAGSVIKLKEEISGRITPLAVIPESAKKSVILIGGESGSGISFHTVPDTAWFTIDRRFNPEESLEDAKKEIIDLLQEQKSKGIDLSYEILQEGESSLSDAEGILAKALSSSILDVTGTAPRFELCPGLLECRFFSKHGIPSYSYGPGLLEVSHGPAEFVEIAAVLDYVKIFTILGNTFFDKQV